MSGRIQAGSADAAADDLYGNSITPIEIIELKGDSGPQGSLVERLNASLNQKITINDLIMFSRQMYSLNKAGMPLDRSLKGIEASIQNIPMKRVLRDISGQLEKGMDLAGSFGRHPKVFSPLYVSLVHVGENTGRLDQAFEQIGKYLELERDTSKQIKTATRYPMFVMIAIAVALAVITVFVIPVFANTFAQLDAELPWQTRVLIAVSDFVVAWWMYILALLAISWFSFMHYIKTPAGRLVWDRRKLQIPLVGSIFERVALGRFARTFAMMMRAGVPIVQALGVIARAVGNEHIGTHISKMRDAISYGESLHRAAVKSGMFTPLVLQMIAVGEEGGNVDDLLEEVADFYDAEVEYDLKKLGSAIEPILIMFIAGIVLILALGVFLPIWDMANAAR